MITSWPQFQPTQHVDSRLPTRLPTRPRANAFTPQVEEARFIASIASIRILRGIPGSAMLLHESHRLHEQRRCFQQHHLQSTHPLPLIPTGQSFSAFALHKHLPPRSRRPTAASSAIDRPQRNLVFVDTAAADVRITRDSTIARRLSNDGSTLYVAVKGTNSIRVPPGLDSTNLSTKLQSFSSQSQR